MIYFDNAATTPPICFSDASLIHIPFADIPLADAPSEPIFYGNPSSPHALGISAERALTQARRVLAELLHCQADELFFTSGGTESNNLAILGFALANMKVVPMIYAEPWAHPSVLTPILQAENYGWAKTQIAPISDWEIASLHSATQNTALSARPALYCFSQMNHETGDVTDVSAFAKQIKNVNPAAVIFVDGAQGFCKMPDGANVFFASDMYTFSGHKCHAPTGVGGIFKRKGVKISPLIHGGGQEHNLRSGTQNTAAIIHLAHTALFLSENLRAHFDNVKQLQSHLLVELLKIPLSQRNALTADPAPFITNISFPGTKGEVLVHMLSEKGIYVATGAACKSKKSAKSALAVMNFPKEIAESAIRISLSHLNTQAEINEAVPIIAQCVAQLGRVGARIARPNNIYL